MYVKQDGPYAMAGPTRELVDRVQIHQPASGLFFLSWLIGSIRERGADWSAYSSEETVRSEWRAITEDLTRRFGEDHASLSSSLGASVVRGLREIRDTLAALRLPFPPFADVAMQEGL